MPSSASEQPSNATVAILPPCSSCCSSRAGDRRACMGCLASRCRQAAGANLVISVRARDTARESAPKLHPSGSPRHGVRARTGEPERSRRGADRAPAGSAINLRLDGLFAENPAPRVQATSEGGSDGYRCQSDPCAGRRDSHFGPLTRRCPSHRRLCRRLVSPISGRVGAASAHGARAKPRSSSVRERWGALPGAPNTMESEELTRDDVRELLNRAPRDDAGRLEPTLARPAR